MQNRYKIYPDIHLGVSKLTPGKKTFEEIFALAKQFRLDKDFPEVHYQLTDLRGCSFDFKTDKIKDLASLIENFKNIDNQKLGVYIVDQPLETAYVLLFFRSINVKREFCSTLEKAHKLINIPISLQELESLIDI